jgi:hypothetical protein
MPEGPQPGPPEYRAKADELRSLARQTSFPDIRDQLLRIAAGFDLLARRVEERDRIAAD